MTPLEQAAKRTAFRRALLRWYRADARDLPWRRTDDPYLIWLSEAMLQQTQVATVIPYFERFRTAYPTVADLANAPIDDVLKQWEGLGYYSRARNLHKAAQQIAEAGEFPESAEQWQTLPGIGRYTAAAIASITRDEPVAVLDGNVKRVLARLYAVQAPINSSATERRLWTLAEELLAKRSAGAFNQAMMELGSEICTPRGPRCLQCPVRHSCAAAAQGLAERLPIKNRSAKPKPIEGLAALVEYRGRLLVRKRPDDGLLGGLWELPTVLENPVTAEALADLVRRLTGSCPPLGAVEATVTHTFTHRRLTLSVYRVALNNRPLDGNGSDQQRWLRREELDAVALGKMYHKALAAVWGTAVVSLARRS